MVPEAAQSRSHVQGRDCRTLIEAKRGEHGWHIEELAIQPDHVHRCVGVWPTTRAVDVL